MPAAEVQPGTAPPRIGLSTYREPADFGVWHREPADLLPVGYADAVAAAGGLPLLLPPWPGVDPQPAARAAVAALDGLVLSGGPDVDPARYGAAAHAETDMPRVERDAWELALVAAALAADLPLLAVCRGVQVLAVACGGSLVQHLPDDVGAAHAPTRGAYGRHPVTTVAGTRLAALLGPRVEVATYHHQAVGTVPPGLTVGARADDGTIEALEVDAAGWAVGVQWHPEVHDGAALFGAFVDRCRGGTG